MTNDQTKSNNPTKTKLWIDVAIFIGFLIAMEPRSTGIAIHEWLTLSALAAIMVHLLLNWDWIAQVTRRFLGKVSGRSQINYILNWLLLIDGILLMLSGILISESVVPMLNISLPAGFAWKQLHDMSANISLILLGLHTALHWGWIVNAFKNFIVRPIGRIFPSKRAARKDVTT
jgi:hypothetical protein